MKKQTLTNNQIETLKNNIRAAVQYHTDDTDYMSGKLHQIQELLRLAFDLHLIDEYKDVTKIQEEIATAGLEELKQIRRATA